MAVDREKDSPDLTCPGGTRFTRAQAAAPHSTRDENRNRHLGNPGWIRHTQLMPNGSQLSVRARGTPQAELGGALTPLPCWAAIQNCRTLDNPRVLVRYTAGKHELFYKVGRDCACPTLLHWLTGVGARLRCAAGVNLVSRTLTCNYNHRRPRLPGHTIACTSLQPLIQSASVTLMIYHHRD